MKRSFQLHCHSERVLVAFRLPLRPLPRLRQLAMPRQRHLPPKLQMRLLPRRAAGRERSSLPPRHRVARNWSGSSGRQTWQQKSSPAMTAQRKNESVSKCRSRFNENEDPGSLVVVVAVAVDVVICIFAVVYSSWYFSVNVVDVVDVDVVVVNDLVVVVNDLVVVVLLFLQLPWKPQNH
jgi:hypothetical protein